MPSAAFPVSVTGLGSYLPPDVVSNGDLAVVLDTDDRWIVERTGIRERHRAGPGQATSDLAIEAGKVALADAGLGTDDVAAVIVCTTTPDHTLPGTAPTVAAALGSQVGAFDLQAACSGFVYGLEVAAAMVVARQNPILLIAAETLTRAVNPDDRTTAVLFGDGAGAVVLAPDADGALGPFDVGSDGTLRDILATPAGGSRYPATPDAVADGEHYLTMRGREVYRHAVLRMAASCGAVLERAGLTPEDVDLFVGHQANLRILQAVADRVGMGPEQVHVTVHKHANTSAASIPLALADAREEGRLHDGDRILLTAFGAGLTWASTLVTWKDPS